MVFKCCGQRPKELSDSEVQQKIFSESSEKAGRCGSKTITMRPAAKYALLALAGFTALAIIGGALALHYTVGLSTAFHTSATWLQQHWLHVTIGASGVITGALVVKFAPRVGSKIVDALEKAHKTCTRKEEDTENEIIYNPEQDTDTWVVTDDTVDID